MPNESGATVGRIIAAIELQRGTFSRDITGAERSLTSLQDQAERTGRAVSSSSGSYARATSSIQGLTDSSGRLRATQLSLASAQARFNTVTAQTGAAQTRLRTSQAELNSAQAQYARLTADSTATAEELAAAETTVAAAQERFTAAMIAGEAATGRLASSEASLIRAQERLATVQAPADPGGMGRLRTSAMGAIETFGKLGLSLGAFEIAMKAIEQIKAGAAFQQQMLMIQTNANASTQEVQQMSRAILGLAGEVGAAPTELATSLYHVEQNGLRGAKALDVVKIAAQGAQVGNADLEATTNSMTAAVASGIPGVQNMSQAMGALITIVGTGDMKMSDLNDALGSGLLAVSKGYGLSLKDVGAALAVFGDNNIRGADAATALRQTIMAFAKPAATAKKDFAEIGMSVNDLGKDMATGGLNKAVQDLNSHMVAAGVTGTKVGAFLTDAFGKKAGVGLSVLMEQIDRFNTKQEEIAAGSGSFAAKWAASTHTAQFAFKQLSAEAEAAGISIYNKMQPSLYAVAKFFGATLPDAVAGTQRALHPLEQELTAVLVPALKVTGDVLGAAAHLLGDVGSIASRHTGTIQVLGTVIIGMWAAWKGYTIATSAARAISGALDTIRLKAMYARDSVAASGGIGGAIATSVNPAGLALAGIGVALGVAAYAWQKHQAAVEADKQAVLDYTAAIKEDSGAIGDNAKQHAISALQSAGAFDAARKFGLSLSDVTDASLGNAEALAKVNGVLNDWKSAMDASGASADNVSGDTDGAAKAYYKLKDAIGSNNSEVQKAIQAYKDQQAAQGKSATVAGEQSAAQAALNTQLQWTVDSAGNIVQSQASMSTAADGTTQSLQQQKTAAELLKQAWDSLNGVAASVEQTQDQFLDGFDSLTQSVKNNGTSLDQNTTSGRANREVLQQQISLAQSAAQAIANKVAATQGDTAGMLAGNAAMKGYETQIYKVAASLHLNKQQTDAMIKSLGALGDIKPVITPEMKTAAAKQQIADLQKKIDDIRQHTPPNILAHDADLQHQIAADQAKINALRGKTVPIGADTGAAMRKIGDLTTAIRQMPDGKTVTITYAENDRTAHPGVGQVVAARALGGPIRRAGGGMVVGGGTGTSDSVPAFNTLSGRAYALSTGEYVSTAASTSRNAAALAAGNRGALLVPVGQISSPAATVAATVSAAPMAASSSKDRDALLGAVLAVGRAAAKESIVVLDGKEIGRVVNGELQQAVDALERTLRYR